MQDSEEFRMTYSGLLTHNGKKTVRVIFERGENAYAEGMVPGGTIEKSSGLSKAEVLMLGNYLKNNADDILERAKEVNPLKDWLHGK